MNLSDVPMSALEKYKKKKSGNGPKTGADKDDVNSTTALLKRQGLEDVKSDYFKKRKDKQKEKGIL